MSIGATLLAYGRLQRSQWWDRDRLRQRQQARLRRLVAHAYRTVPYYRQRLDQAGVTPTEISGLADLALLPVTTKADLQAAGRAATVSSAFDPLEIVHERTSGSTGRPLTTAFDRRFVAVRDALFLRVLTTAGYRPWDRLMLITSDRPKPRRRWPRWRYASIEAPPGALLEQFDAFRPTVLYGCLTPLRQMALLARARARPTHQPKAVISVAEGLDLASRHLLESTFGAPVHDAYGLTEVGMIGWQCSARRGWHLAEDTAIVELLPAPQGGPARLVVTNLELMAMPLLRFDTGDLAALAEADGCACGRRLLRIGRIEGRAVDCIRLADGGLISPYRFTLALERLAGLRRYQLIQVDLERFVLRVEPSPGAACDHLAAAGAGAVRALVGPGAEVDLVVEATLDPPPGRKFRVVESRLGSRPIPGTSGTV